MPSNFGTELELSRYLLQLLRPGILKDIVDRCNDQNSSALTIARGVITDLPVAVVIELYRDSIGTR